MSHSGSLQSSPELRSASRSHHSREKLELTTLKRDHDSNQVSTCFSLMGLLPKQPLKSAYSLIRTSPGQHLAKQAGQRRSQLQAKFRQQGTIPTFNWHPNHRKLSWCVSQRAGRPLTPLFPGHLHRILCLGCLCRLSTEHTVLCTPNGGWCFCSSGSCRQYHAYLSLGYSFSMIAMYSWYSSSGPSLYSAGGWFKEMM